MSDDYNKSRKEFNVILNTYIPASSSAEDEVACAVDILKAVMKNELLLNSDFKVSFWKNIEGELEKSDRMIYIVKGKEIISLLQDHKEA